MPFWHRRENLESACDEPEKVPGQFQDRVEGYRGRRHGPELAVQVYSSGTGIEIQDLPAARKDTVEEPLRPMPAPTEVADQLALTNEDEDETMPADEPMGSRPPVVEAQAKGDEVEDTEMAGEAWPPRGCVNRPCRDRKPRVRDQYRRGGDCWKQLGSWLIHLTHQGTSWRRYQPIVY